MKKIICSLLVFVLIFCAACSGKPEEERKGHERPDSPVIEGKWVVKDGVSDYSVLIPDSAPATTQLAASELQFFFDRATDINLKIKTDSEYSANGKYISFGNTSVAGAVSVSNTELGSQGFKIKTEGDNIIVNAVGSHGLLWGAYELLSMMFNYEYYAKDVYYIDTEVKDCPLKDYNVTDKPDIETRAVADSQGYNDIEVAHRFRQMKVYDEFFLPMKNVYHNSFDYVADAEGNIDPRYLATSKGQLCYTGQGDDAVVEEMLDKSVEYLKPIIARSDRNNAVFGVQDDSTEFCNCSACQACKERYGTDSAAMILFMNRLRTKLDAYLQEANIGRQINLYYTAYYSMTQPPVHKDGNGYVANDQSLVLKEGVGVLFAPIYSNFTQSIYSQTNVSTYEQLKGFKAITNNLLVWTYACNFEDFFLPYDSITYMPELFQAIVDNNGTYLFNQGRHSQENSSQFDVLRQYLVAKLGWDVYADVGQLTDDFFNVYFGKAKEPMRKMYDELRTVMRYNSDVLGMSAGVTADVSDKKYWPAQLLNHWLDLIEEAYTLAGDDKDLNERILRESIFVRYYQLKYYVSESKEAEEMKKQFIKDAMAVGIARASEHKAITDAFS